MKYASDTGVLWIYLVAFLEIVSENFCQGCPSRCVCNVDTRIVYCSSKNLAKIPQGIPSNAKQILLHDNNFQYPTLARSNFTKYVDLENLYLSDCDIQEINIDTFVDLVKLKWLDLSRNRLRIVYDYTFYRLNSLTRLFLSENRNVRISKHSFVGLTKLQGLRLDGCELSTLDYEALLPLNESLKSLRLNNNNLQAINPEFRSIFNGLTHLRLNENPLHCNCKAKWLKDFVMSNSRLFAGNGQPTCGHPKIFLKKPFSQVDGFVCDSPSFSDMSFTLSDNGGLLNCAARGDPLPVVSWTKPSGEKNTYYPPVGFDSEETKATLKISEDSSDNVKGIYACVASNLAGNVTLTLNVSWTSRSLDPVETTTAQPGQNLPTERVTKVTSFSNSHKSTVKTSINTLSHEPRTIPSVNRDHIKVASKPSTQDNTTVADSGRTFGLIELVFAILGTFFGTSIVSILIFFLFFRGRRRREQRSRCRQKLCNHHQHMQGHESHCFVNNHKQHMYQTKPALPEIMEFIETCETKENHENHQQNLNY